MTIRKSAQVNKNVSQIILAEKNSKFKGYGFAKQERDYILNRIEKDNKLISINHYDKWSFVQILDTSREEYLLMEDARNAANKLHSHLNFAGLTNVAVVNGTKNKSLSTAYAEGLALSNYQFLKYFKDKKDKLNSLKRIDVVDKYVKKADLDKLNSVVEAVYLTRDLVNEPVAYLTASKLAQEIRKAGRKAGFKVNVFNKKKITELKMGGLLAVNSGSIDPPTFTIMEWKPAKPKNKQPIALVGKGVVFDTGGLSLKPTKGSMDEMKCDMAGAATVAGVMYAAAKNKLPLHLIAFVPATDNRPDGNAYTPGDVIKMHNGMTVEVLNTDAEGRMILADALSYSNRYKPELVIDAATLTGAAAAAIGKYGIVGMGNADEKYFVKLKESGKNVFERLARFPFWDDYADLMKSDIADLKNIGGPAAGAITAGKFLENFTEYPYIHLDIAGPAFLTGGYGYRGKGGTGFGVRLIYNFLENL